VQVKNKSAAPVQITAEQILREALERQEAEPKPPKQKITDPEELADYRYVVNTSCLYMSIIVVLTLY
jgi:hypothetical protein